jgi:AraC-like DNA-binding protein
MFELELSLEAGGISYIDDDSHEISEGLFICARPGQMRHTRVPYRCAYIHFILPEGALYDLLCQCPIYSTPENAAKIREIFEEMMTYYESRLPRDRVMLQSLLFRLVYMISASAAETGEYKGCEGGDVIRRALSYIRENLNGDLRLSTVADHVSFSPVYFHNYFRSATGVTLREYVEEQRIKRAAVLLVDTGYTLSRIAYECGFSSQAYFSYAFKRRMGKTPRAYTAEMLARYDRDKTESDE